MDFFSVERRRQARVILADDALRGPKQYRFESFFGMTHRRHLTCFVEVFGMWNHVFYRLIFVMSDGWNVLIGDEIPTMTQRKECVVVIGAMSSCVAL